MMHWSLASMRWQRMPRKPTCCSTSIYRTELVCGGNSLYTGMWAIEVHCAAAGCSWLQHCLSDLVLMRASLTSVSSVYSSHSDTLPESRVDV